MQKQKGFLLLVIGLIIAGVIAVAVGGIWVYQNYFLIPKPVVCTPNWQCSWGPCTNGSQSQVAVDSNNCGQPVSSAKIACPALARICTSSTTPSITVTSPNGGDVWQAINDVNTIKWTYNGINDASSASIEIVDQNNKTVCDVSEGFVSLKDKQLTVSHDYLSVSGCVGNSRRVQMIFHGNQTTTPNYDVTGYSNYFSIVAPTTKSSITVTSPNGGETLKIGNTYPIKWSIVGSNSNDIYVALVLNMGGVTAPCKPQIVKLTNGTSNTGVYNWNILSEYSSDYCGSVKLAGNQFKIEVSSRDASGRIVLYDDSDNYFSIVAP